jgi:hypothetical protein
MPEMCRGLPLDQQCSRGIRLKLPSIPFDIETRPKQSHTAGSGFILFSPQNLDLLRGKREGSGEYQGGSEGACEMNKRIILHSHKDCPFTGRRRLKAWLDYALIDMELQLRLSSEASMPVSGGGLHDGH